LRSYSLHINTPFYSETNAESVAVACITRYDILKPNTKSGKVQTTTPGSRCHKRSLIAWKLKNEFSNIIVLTLRHSWPS